MFQLYVLVYQQRRIAEIEANYQREISVLETELAKVASRAGTVEIHSEKHHEVKSELDSQSRSTEMHLQEREDGEV